MYIITMYNIMCVQINTEKDYKKTLLLGNREMEYSFFI